MNHNFSTFQPFNFSTFHPFTPSPVKPLRNALAALLLLPCAAIAQDIPVPEPAAAEPAATNTVPPVLVRDIRVQTIGEERHLEELPEGLLFVDATTGKLCLADENDPHGRYVCLCRDIDWHTFTNTVKFNGHRLEFNQFWSQVAEGGSLLYRFGTNSWLRLVGASSGDFCPFTVDAYDPTNGTMVLTADVTSSPVLQVCTNLLEADAWQTATNAAVTTTTDASTTWTITLLGTPFETYSILATVHLPAGIHAERPLHANQGIVMDGETWDHWPDVSGIASNAAAISGHTENTNNPHAVTLMQAFYADPDEAYEGFGISVSGGDGISELRGFNHRIGFEEGFIEGDFDFSSRPTFDGTGLATTNEVAAVASAVATNAGNIATNTESIGLLDGRVSTLEGYHEWPETCWLYWSNDFVTNHMDTNCVLFVPTNFPTRKLDVSVSDQTITNLYIRIPADFRPARDVEITISVICDSNDSSTRNTTIGFDGVPSFLNIQARSQYRVASFCYESHYGIWIERSYTSPVRQYSRKDGSNLRLFFPDSLSATVEEWIEDMTNPPAQSLYMSPAVSPGLTPFSPEVLQPKEELSFDGLAEESGDALDFRESGEAAE